jgi:hypothetical protein
MTKRSTILAALLAATMFTGPVVAQDALVDGFENPPETAKPRVWWHWMNGNVTQDGIEKDLEWLKRIGIGGIQTFDANLVTPQLVEKRLIYMTPEWKDAFRFAATKAEALGLELTIAASPGWSETGGPWVKPENGIKKLAWSETVLEGGKRYSGRLAQPPAIAGPYQDLVAEGDALTVASGAEQFKPPALYADVSVFAYRIAGHDTLSAPKLLEADGVPVDGASLLDDSLTSGVDVARGTAAKPTIIAVAFHKPQTVRTLSFHAVGGAAMFGAANYLPSLEASFDAKSWTKVAELVLTPVPTTISFAPVTASHFRVVMAPNPNGGITGFTPAPGIDFAPIAPLLAPKPKIKIAEFRLSSEARVNQFEAKAGFATMLGYHPFTTNGESDGEGIAPADVIDLSGRMKADGTLDWTPPKGSWRVVRLGWSLTGKTNHPAPLEATGLEVDKLDARAVREYLEHYIATYRETVGPDLIGKAGVKAILTDSTEAGSFNWTPDMLAQFKKLRGYDAGPWLPVLTGAIVGSRAKSDAFLYDYRRTIGDLHASEHYGTIAAVAREHGLKLYGEALEDRRPSLGDDIAMRRYADYPMSALWTYPRGGDPRPTLLGDMRGAASVAHLYGQNIAAAESMTSALQPWAHSPADLRRVIDLEFANGINRPVLHTSVHQPLDARPGIPLWIFGQYFTRHDTWAEMAKPWVDYIARNSFMLQQGRNHADVAYFYGEDSPLTALYAEKPLTDVPQSFAYDFVNSEVLANLLTVEKGALTAPSGARYKALYLGGTSAKMTLPTLQRIAALAEAGATIIGSAPTGSPGLVDDERQYKALVARLWPGNGEAKIGLGRVIDGTDVEAALRGIGTVPDFEYTKAAPDSEILFVHRTLPDGELYFVNNRRDRQEAIEARFAVTGKQPELWRADTGKREALSYRIENGVTVVPLDLAAEESVYVLFRKDAVETSSTVAKTVYAPAMTLEGPWKIVFEQGLGAPATLELQKLASLSEQADPGVKYFSGIATYSQSFKLPSGVRPGQKLMLNLGGVGDVAEVRVNGEAVATLWKSPYQVDIGNAVKLGTNWIEVKVANLWVNRLIGDAQEGAIRIASTTQATYVASAPLRPSGLIGPVTLSAAVGK